MDNNEKAYIVRQVGKSFRKLNLGRVIKKLLRAREEWHCQDEAHIRDQCPKLKGKEKEKTKGWEEDKKELEDHMKWLFFIKGRSNQR